MQAINDEFCDHNEAVPPFVVEFEKDSIVIKIHKRGHRNVLIPFPDGLDVDGWNITPDNPPEVSNSCTIGF